MGAITNEIALAIPLWAGRKCHIFGRVRRRVWLGFQREYPFGTGMYDSYGVAFVIRPRRAYALKRGTDRVQKGNTESTP